MWFLAWLGLLIQPSHAERCTDRGSASPIFQRDEISCLERARSFCERQDRAEPSRRYDALLDREARLLRGRPASARRVVACMKSRQARLERFFSQLDRQLESGPGLIRLDPPEDIGGGFGDLENLLPIYLSPDVSGGSLLLNFAPGIRTGMNTLDPGLAPLYLGGNDSFGPMFRSAAEALTRFNEGATDAFSTRFRSVLESPPTETVRLDRLEAAFPGRGIGEMVGAAPGEEAPILRMETALVLAHLLQSRAPAQVSQAYRGFIRARLGAFRESRRNFARLESWPGRRNAGENFTGTLFRNDLGACLGDLSTADHGALARQIGRDSRYRSQRRRVEDRIRDLRDAVGSVLSSGWHAPRSGNPGARFAEALDLNPLPDSDRETFARVLRDVAVVHPDQALDPTRLGTGVWFDLNGNLIRLEPGFYPLLDQPGQELYVSWVIAHELTHALDAHARGATSHATQPPPAPASPAAVSAIASMRAVCQYDESGPDAGGRSTSEDFADFLAAHAIGRLPDSAWTAERMEGLAAGICSTSPDPVLPERHGYSKAHERLYRVLLQSPRLQRHLGCSARPWCNPSPPAVDSSLRMGR